MTNVWVVYQQYTMGPTVMDIIGKLCVQPGEDLYTYKGIVKIPPLAMFDDLLGKAKCGPRYKDFVTKTGKEDNE